MSSPGQLCFEQSGAAIRDVTFVVLDCETTGTSTVDGSMTELAAVKICGGEELDVFQTLINPRMRINPLISRLTGINDEDVANAPYVEDILDEFLAFCGDAIIVGHNVRFDLAFINAALQQHNYSPLENEFLDTLKLARRIIPGETRNYKLSTLAAYTRTERLPTHRALADVYATVDLLHYLIGRSSALGVQGIKDLFTIPTKQKRTRFLKRTLADDAPRGPGTYLFLNGDGEILYAGMSRDIRTRLRAYFLSDERRNVDKLLRDARSMEYIRTDTAFEARICEIRILQDVQPTYNIRDVDVRRMHYVVMDTCESVPTFRVVTRSPRLHEYTLGPFPSRRSTQQLCEALQHVFSLRACARECVPGTITTSLPCINSLRGIHSCFCNDGWDGLDSYCERAHEATQTIHKDYSHFAQQLLSQMKHFSDQLQFEKAKIMYDYAHSLQKWMNRFALLEKHAGFSRKPSKECPEIIHGRPIIRYRHSGALTETVSEILESHHCTIKSQVVDNSGNPYLCPPDEFRERLYTAAFLARTNIFNK